MFNIHTFTHNFIRYRNDTVIGEGYFKRLTLKFFLSDKSVISDYRF
jgi:hypothetical protein